MAPTGIGPWRIWRRSAQPHHSLQSLFQLEEFLNWMTRTTMWCMKNRSLTIRLEDDLEQELEAVCAETGRSRGEIVRDALRRQLQLMRFERLRRQALPFGEAAGWLTDDDVFAAIS